MDRVDELRAPLKEYFLTRPEVAMAFLFGSAAHSRRTADSDLDVAVYSPPAGRSVEWEEQREYPGEHGICADIERITSIDADLLVLNRAPATVTYAVLEENCPIVVKDLSLYWGLFLSVSSPVEDFRQFTREFLEIKQRSRSLSEIDTDRLRRIVDFLSAEIADAGDFSSLTRESYLTDSGRRRNVERWIENIVSASIDIAKILLALARARAISQRGANAPTSTSGIDRYVRSIAIRGFGKNDMHVQVLDTPEVLLVVGSDEDAAPE